LKLVEIGALCVRSRPAGNIADKETRLGVTLDDKPERSHDEASSPTSVTLRSTACFVQPPLPLSGNPLPHANYAPDAIGGLVKLDDLASTRQDSSDHDPSGAVVRDDFSGLLLTSLTVAITSSSGMLPMT
jgi:hypothetical protein